MPNNYKDSAHMPRISSFEVTVDDHVMEIDADPLSALFELASLVGEHQTSGPTIGYMSDDVLRVLQDTPTLEQLQALPHGSPIRWRGEPATFAGVSEYRGAPVVWLHEVNGPIGREMWHGLQLSPQAGARPFIEGTMTFTQGSPADLFDHAPTPRQRSHKRRDTKPARKPRSKDRRSPRHTQRRK